MGVLIHLSVHEKDTDATRLMLDISHTSKTRKGVAEVAENFFVNGIAELGWKLKDWSFERTVARRSWLHPVV